MIPSSARSLDALTGTAARQVSCCAALRPMRVLLINQYFPPDTAATAKIAVLVARALADDVDVVLAMTDPPVAGIAGALIATLRRLPFVYNIRDLYPEMAVAAGLLRPGPLAAAWERLHRWALRQADLVVVLGEDMRERIVAKGIPAERVVVVRDGAPIPTAVPGIDHPVAREVRGGFRFVVLHAGNLGFYGA